MPETAFSLPVTGFVSDGTCIFDIKKRDSADSWPWRHFIKVMRRHDKSIHPKTKRKTKTFGECIQRVIQDTLNRRDLFFQNVQIFPFFQCFLWVIKIFRIGKEKRCLKFLKKRIGSHDLAKRWKMLLLFDGINYWDFSHGGRICCYVVGIKNLRDLLS